MMNKKTFYSGYFLFCLCVLFHSHVSAQANPQSYLDYVKSEMTKLWPNNRTINLVFHGHSVPAGYGDRHEVHTLWAYPHVLLKKLKEKYPYAVINIIVTAIGGEHSISGEKRFATDVLPLKPDVLFIDYALNDRFQPIDSVKKAYESMIRQAQQRGIKVVLLTPSPDQRVDILASDDPLKPYADQIKGLAATYHTGLADPYAHFKEIAGHSPIREYMESVNHPNALGHEIIAAELMKWF